MRLDASQEAHFGIEINPYPFPSQMPSRHKDPVVQLLSHVRLFMTQRTAACQASLSFTISQSLLKLMSIESVMPSSPIALYLSQHQGLFQRVGSSHQVVKLLGIQLQHQSFQKILMADFL